MTGSVQPVSQGLPAWYGRVIPRMSGSRFSPITVALSSDDDGDDSPVVIEIKDSPVKLVVSPPFKYVLYITGTVFQALFFYTEAI